MIVAAAVMAVAGVSRRLTGTPITTAMAFVLIGLIAGPFITDEVKLSPRSEIVRTLAEATLAVVLFADASRIKLRALRREYNVPLRLLAVGLPLTIVAGALAGALLLHALSVVEVVVLAIVLAPTDAALGQAVVIAPSLPSRIRQGLNVESGLNDGICVPLLLLALAAAEIEANASVSHHAIKVVGEQLGYGLLGGLVAGVVSTGVVKLACDRELITGAWLQVIPVSGAALAYGVATALGGSGFIAAFVAGGLFGYFAGHESEKASRLSEELGDLLDGITFLMFGAILLGPALMHLSVAAAVYGMLSLTLVRMLPVAIAMAGSGASWQTVGFLGWFGPRGLASIVFAVIVVEDANLPATNTILVATYATIGLSVFAHGITAAPLAQRYAQWYANHSPGPQRLMEAASAATPRPRGAAATQESQPSDI
ncbi:MAG TPA: cation:proton antiporter [Solirubrobacteraceae bacterium]|nr:cation:proton antiporter [Solirubrobacteraceae bacterium]